MAESENEKPPRIPLGSPPYRWPDWYRNLEKTPDVVLRQMEVEK